MRAFRDIERSDLEKGYMELLSQLTKAPAVSQEVFEARVRHVDANPDHHVIVCEVDGRIVASGSVLIERKFIRACASCGHIEDVVVDTSQRGTGLGKELVQHLVMKAKACGCYKVILDCAEHNVSFYQKVGLKRSDVHMIKYFEEGST